MEEPTDDDIRAVGTKATVLQLFKLPDGSVKALVEGLERVRIERFEADEPHFVVSYTPLAPQGKAAARSRSLARRVLSEFVSYVQMNPQLGDEVQYVVAQTQDPDEIADIVAAHLQVSLDEKQALLETASTQQRLLALLESLAEENAVLGLEQEIARKVQERIEGAQRQIVLQEKLRVIRDEIEEGGQAADDETRRVRRPSGRATALAGRHEAGGARAAASCGRRHR